MIVTRGYGSSAPGPNPIVTRGFEGVSYWGEVLRLESRLQRQINLESPLQRQVDLDSKLQRQVDLESPLGYEELTDG